MAYQMAATAVTLNDLEGHSLVADLFKCICGWHLHNSFFFVTVRNTFFHLELSRTLPAKPCHSRQR